MILVRKPVPTFRGSCLLREQHRGKFPAAGDGGLVRRAPGIEQLHELLARAVVVPFAVALDDRDQVVGCRVAIALGILGEREIETGLMIGRICGDLGLQIGD